MKNQWKRVLAISAAVVAAAASIPSGSMQVRAEERVYDVTVTNHELQTMDGLGGSIAFNKAYPLHKISKTNPERAQELFDLLYDDELGIGLDIVRVLLGDGGITNPETGEEWGNRYYDGPSDTIWPEPGIENIVWNRDDWAQKKDAFDEDQVWYMKKAMEYGVNTFYADAWSPPYWMKQNNSVLGQNNSFLKEECYDDYAYYLVEYALGYKREFGIPITHIGPTNESESAHSGYSGFILQGEDYKKFIVDYLGPELEKRAGEFKALGMEVPKVVGPEGTNMGVSTNMKQTQGWWGLTGSLYGKTLSDEAVQKVISVFSTHLYGSAGMFENGPAIAEETNNYPEFLRSYTLWQTEYMTQNNSNSSATANTQVYDNQGIKDGIYWANLISNMFASDPGFNAYLWWWPLGANGADGSDLIRFCNTGSPQGNGCTVTGEYRAFKRFYTFGNFSRFINPGDVRVAADRVPAEGVNVTAYKDPETDEYKIVAVNSGSDERTVKFTFDEDYPLTGSRVVGYRTTASENQKRMDSIVMDGRAFTVQIPANSVITFVPENGHNLPGLNGKRDIFSTLEAEDNDGASKVPALVETADGEAVAGLQNGSYLKFANINFNEGSANGGIVRRHVLSMDAVLASINGGQIEVRTDDPEKGRLVGLFTIPGKNNPDVYDHYTIQLDTGDTGAYGYRDLYLVLRGNGGELFRIDRFEFGEKLVPFDNLLSNPGFENDPAGTWTSPTGNSETNYERTSEQNYSAPLTEAKSTTAYSLKVSNRSDAGEGAAQILDRMLVSGGVYRAAAFFMPVKSGATGSIELEMLNKDGTVLDRKTVARRTDLKEFVWSQVDGVFTFEEPLEEVTSVRFLLKTDTNDTLYLEEASLVPYYDKKDLIKTLNISYDPSRYLEQDLAYLESAVDAGWKTVADPMADWEVIAAAVQKVREALDRQLPELDREELLAAIAEAEAVDGSMFAPESYGFVLEKLAVAKALAAADVSGGDAVTQADVDMAARELRDATAALSEMPVAPEWTQLKKVIAQAQALDSQKYTQESYSAVSAALMDAIALLNGDVSDGDVSGGDVSGGDSIQDRIDLAVRRLEEAMESLEEKEPVTQPVDKSGLQAAVNEAKSIDMGKYTAESYAELLRTVLEAEAVLADEGSSQQSVDAACAAVRQALAGLTEKSDYGGSEDGGRDDGNGGESNDATEQSRSGSADGGAKSPRTYDSGSSVPAAAAAIAALMTGAFGAAYFRKRDKRP